MKNQLVISTFFFVVFLVCPCKLWPQVIAGGAAHSILLCNDGSVMSCGSNAVGQLGVSSASQTSLPVQVNVAGTFISVSAGAEHSLLLKSDGTVWACGSNTYGQLGDGTNVNKTTPVMINSLSGIVAVSAGRIFSLFLKNDGTAWACGNNYWGQLGDGTGVGNSTPVKVNSLTGIVAISAGEEGHSLFLKNDGTVWACGYNNQGALGDGTTLQKLSPVRVDTLTGIVAISAGFGHSLFVKNDGTAWGCGRNIMGQLGGGNSFGNFLVRPSQINMLNNVISVSAGSEHSLFLKNDGSAWSCGLNTSGQLGWVTGPTGGNPVQISSLSNIVEIAAGNAHSLFLKNNGTVWACGLNDDGELGNGTILNQNPPVQISGLCSVTGMKEVQNNIKFSLFPNPSNGKFIVHLENGYGPQFRIEIIDLFGESFYDKIINSSETELDLRYKTPGVYFYKLRSDKNILKRGKLIIE